MGAAGGGVAATGAWARTMTEDKASAAINREPKAKREAGAVGRRILY